MDQNLIICLSSSGLRFIVDLKTLQASSVTLSTEALDFYAMLRNTEASPDGKSASTIETATPVLIRQADGIAQAVLKQEGSLFELCETHAIKISDNCALPEGDYKLLCLSRSVFVVWQRDVLQVSRQLVPPTFSEIVGRSGHWRIKKRVYCINNSLNRLFYPVISSPAIPL